MLTERLETRTGQPAFLQIAQDRITEQQTLDAMIRVLLVGGAIVVLVALAFGAIYAERALVPIRDSLASQRGPCAGSASSPPTRATNCAPR